MFGMLIAVTTSNVITAATAHNAFRRLVITPPVQKTAIDLILVVYAGILLL
jgi:hypothetical protein